MPSNCWPKAAHGGRRRAMRLNGLTHLQRLTLGSHPSRAMPFCDQIVDCAEKRKLLRQDREVDCAEQLSHRASSCAQWAACPLLPSGLCTTLSAVRPHLRGKGGPRVRGLTGQNACSFVPAITRGIQSDSSGWSGSARTWQLVCEGEWGASANGCALATDFRATVVTGLRPCECTSQRR